MTSQGFFFMFPETQAIWQKQNWINWNWNQIKDSTFCRMHIKKTQQHDNEHKRNHPEEKKLKYKKQIFKY